MVFKHLKQHSIPPLHSNEVITEDIWAIKTYLILLSATAENPASPSSHSHTFKNLKVCLCHSDNP